MSMHIRYLEKQEVRVFAYQYVNENGKDIPDKWKDGKKADREWLLKPCTGLYPRKPEATSLLNKFQ